MATNPSSPAVVDRPAGDLPLGPVPSAVARWRGMVAALLAALTALGVAELISALIKGTTAPIISVGEYVIDHTPVAVKEYAIRQFGTNDKPMLMLGTVVLLLVFALIIGFFAARHLWVGVAGIAAFGFVGMATAVTRPNVEPGRRRHPVLTRSGPGRVAPGRRGVVSRRTRG